MLQVSDMLRAARSPADANGLSGRVPARYAEPGAAPPVVVWNVCHHCNMTCPHCYASAGTRPSPLDLTTGEGLALLDQLADAGVRIVILSGGEPLLREDLLHLARRAARLGLAAQLSTNGVLLSAATAAALRAAGVEYVGVSIDGPPAFNDAYRGLPDAFRRACDGLRNARAAGLRTGLRMTLTRRNARWWPEMIETARELGIDRFYLSHLMCAGRGRTLEAEDLSPNEVRRLLLDLFEWADAAVAGGAGPAIVTGGNDSDGPLLLEWVAERHGLQAAARVRSLLARRGGNSAGEKILSIDHRGRVYPDQFWRSACLGDLREQRFAEVLRHPLRADLRRRETLLRGRCAACRHLDLCRGSHRERAIAACGHLWASDPGCVLTDAEAGLAAGPLEAGGMA